MTVSYRHSRFVVRGASMQRRLCGHERVSVSRWFPSFAAVIGMALLVTSCEGNPNPITGPSQGQTASVAPPPPEPASLVIEELSVGMPPIVLRDGTSWYRVKFFVRETSGHSSATILRIVVKSPDAVDDRDPSCWGDYPITVNAGGTLDLFTPEKVNSLLGDYCAPGALAHSDSFPLGVSITFRDQTGRESLVEASTTITR